MKDTKKNLKNSREMFIENPFFIAIVIFATAFFINYLLELDFTKNFFNWCGYYFNLTIYQLNSFIQPTFKDHPYIKISVFTNPITSEFMTIINPWMWLRGFLISSFVVGQIITLLQIKIIKSRNVVSASILTGIFQLGLYALPSSSMFSFPFFILLIQKFYANIFSVWFVCVAGLFWGIEYGVYLMRHEKIKVVSKTDGPNISVKVIDELDW